MLAAAVGVVIMSATTLASLNVGRVAGAVSLRQLLWAGWAPSRWSW